MPAGDAAAGSTVSKPDRRVARTRQLLQKALMELLGERGYDAVTVQHIVDRANVGRTTFYAHFTSKVDLFLSCHEAILGKFQSGPFFAHPLSREELLAPEVPPGMTSAYQHLGESWARLLPVFQGKDGPLILRRLRVRSAQEIEANLRAAFDEAESRMPLDLLANYVAGAQIAMLQWRLEKRRPHTPEQLAQTFHRLQRAAIREAFGIRESE
jgi:AcrR family transcriptional regulator